MEVRLATPQDAEELLEIYRYYVEHTAITFEYRNTFDNRIPSKDTNRQLKRYPLSGGC